MSAKPGQFMRLMIQMNAAFGRRSMLLKLAVSALVFSAVIAQAQTPIGSSRIYGPDDTDVPTPAHTTNTASDANAVQILINFVKSSLAPGWQGMTAKGSITLAGDPAPHPAVLSVLGSTDYRLDTTLDAGTQSTVFNSVEGAFISASGATSLLSPDVSSLGLIAIPKILSSDYPLPGTLLTDRGVVTLQSTILHRITLDDRATSAQVGNAWETMDLYFDPSTGRLSESTALVHLSTADRALYMMETTYGDYRPTGIGTAILPFTIKQYLNGQLQWTLSLTSIDTTSLPDEARFYF